MLWLIFLAFAFYRAFASAFSFAFPFAFESLLFLRARVVLGRFDCASLTFAFAFLLTFGRAYFGMTGVWAFTHFQPGTIPCPVEFRAISTAWA